MSADTGELIRLAVAVEKRRAVKEAQEYLGLLAVRRNLCWIAAGISFGTALFLSVGFWTGKIHLPNGVISWLGPGLTGFAIMGGLAIQMTINQRMTAAGQKRITDALEGLDSASIGRLAAQLQAIEQAMPALRAAIELDRGVILRQLDANEKQRQSDVSQIRDASVKRLEEIHDQVEQLKAALPSMLEDAARKGYASGYTDALAQGGGGRTLRPVRDDR